MLRSWCRPSFQGCYDPVMCLRRGPTCTPIKNTKRKWVDQGDSGNCRVIEGSIRAWNFKMSN